MQVLTKLIKTAVGTHSILSACDELIATVHETKTSEDSRYGMYRICLYGGVAHGKVVYAKNWQEVNDKSVEILQLFNFNKVSAKQ